MLKAPFQWFGGKRRVAYVCWLAFGANVNNYVEPFFGSGAVLLGRPGGPGKIETVNDKDRFIANFWRAVTADPEAVAAYADWPVNECAPAGTMISTPHGPVPIEKVHAGMLVLGERDGSIVATRVLATHRSEASEFVHIGPLRITGNHPVWTPGKYIDAKHLVGGETIAMLDCVRGNRADVFIDHTGISPSLRFRSVCKPGDSKGLPLSRQTLSFCVAVYNFQTDTGNYFANGILVHNCDMHARHMWLVAQLPEMRVKMHEDPFYYDPMIAGWWVWGLCMWIGGGWCVEPRNHKHPKLDGIGKGVHSNQGHLLPSIGNDRGINSVGAPSCFEWFSRLQERLRRVRVVCGDWKRVLGPSVLGKGKNVGGRRPCAVLLDPPYDPEMRDSGLYSHDDIGVSQRVAEWAREHGDDPELRIALCGYEGEHEMPGWTVYKWKAARGYASAKNSNRHLERIWFSPHCLPIGQQGELFERGE